MTKTNKVNGLKNKKIKSESSKKWLLRQLNDPYVEKSKQEGYRSRAAYKILEIHQKYPLFKKGSVVVDLGAAPGGWCQIASRIAESKTESPSVIGVDLLPIAPMTGVIFLQADFQEQSTIDLILQHLEGRKVDVVLSDMAPSTCGVKSVDHLRIMGLIEEAYDFAKSTLSQGGNFVAKIFQGGTETSFLNILKKDFQKIHHVKPPASRKDSKEIYLVALGFRKS